MSVVLLVYLDQTMPHKPPLLSTLSWTCIGITGAQPSSVLAVACAPLRADNP